MIDSSWSVPYYYSLCGGDWDFATIESWKNFDKVILSKPKQPKNLDVNPENLLVKLLREYWAIYSKSYSIFEKSTKMNSTVFFNNFFFFRECLKQNLITISSGKVMPGSRFPAKLIRGTCNAGWKYFQEFLRTWFPEICPKIQLDAVILTFFHYRYFRNCMSEKKKTRFS